MPKKISQSAGRLHILEAVRKPLTFFVLALLVVEGTFLIVGSRSNQDATVLFALNIGAIVFLTVIVALLAYLGILEGSQSVPYYSIFVEAPDNLPIDINSIVWDEKNCILKVEDRTLPCIPTSPVDSKGASLEITIKSSDFPSDGQSPITLTLTDQFGNRWDVIRFRLWQRHLKLRTRSDPSKIRRDYSGGESR
jgi:hypothetical protein